MSQAPLVVAGIPIPSDSPAFLAVLGVHVLAGLACVLTGLAAMIMRKGRGWHSLLGTLYYRGLLIVWVTMAALAAVRWAEDYYLFVLGTLAFAVAVAARRAVRHQHVRVHLIGMGSSYILLLTAFYVDNGAHLPIWRDLPPLAYWLVPAAVGLPIIGVTLRRHPLAQAERRQAHPGAAA